MRAASTPDLRELLARLRGALGNLRKFGHGPGNVPAAIRAVRAELAKRGLRS